jgi:hypothetical protein
MRITTRARGKNKRRCRRNHITRYLYTPGWKTDEQIELPTATAATKAGLRPNFANNRRRRPLPILFAQMRGFLHTQLDRLLCISATQYYTLDP